MASSDDGMAMVPLTPKECATLAKMCRREMIKHEKQYEKAKFVPEPGKSNMDEIAAKKYRNLLSKLLPYVQ